jgi:hypothetical protein
MRIITACGKENTSNLLMLFNSMLLFLSSVNVEYDEEDVTKYMKYLYSDRKFLAVFNHTSTIDGFIIMKIFQKVSFVMSRLKLTNSLSVYDLIGYTDEYHKRVGSIFVDKGDTTNKIIEKVKNRRDGDNILFIAPCAGITPSMPGCISEFKGSGAFAGKFAILPILMKTEDESLNCHEGESIQHHILKMFLLYNYNVKIKVLDIVEPDESETVEEYKQRVYNIMNEEYKKIDKKVR